MTAVPEPEGSFRAQAQAALRAGNAAAAEAACIALLNQDCTDIHALVGLGLAARKRGDRQAAMRHFQHAASAHPAHAWPLLEISAEYNARGQRMEAKESLRKALAEHPRDYHCLVGLARLLRDAGHADGAADILRRAIEYHPARDGAYAELAAMQLARGQTEEALQLYQAVADNEGAAEPARRDAAFAVFRIARDGQQPALAMTYLKQAARDATHAAIQCELATQYRAAKNWHDADAAYRHVLSLAPSNLAALGGLAIVRRQLGDADAALALLVQAHEVDSANAWIRFELALTWRDRGRLDDACALLELIEPGSGIYVPARMALGHLARARADHHGAAAYFEQAACHAADPVDALCQIAAEHRALGDFIAAASALQRAFAYAPGNWQAFMAQGYLCRAMQNAAGARDAFCRAHEAAPSQIQPWLELATEYGDLGNHDAAAVAIDSALLIDPEHEGALRKRAAWLAESGDAAAALSVYARLREAYPASVWAYLAAAQLMHDGGGAEPALALLAEAGRKCAVDAQIDVRRAGILRQLGKLDESYAVLSAVQARFPRELTPWCHLVSAAIDLGRFSTAEALLAVPPPCPGRGAARVALLRAQLHKARWSLDDAIATFSEAIALDDLDSQVLYERAKLRLVTFDMAGARADLMAHSDKRRTASRRDGRSANPSQTHVGQLYDEFVLESGVAGALAAARVLAPDRQIPALASLIRQFPGSTAAAIGFIIALRRAGQLDLRPEARRDSAIPRLMTQYWNDAVPPADIRVLMQSWRGAEPEFTIDLFDDAAAKAYLSRYSGAAVARAFAMAAEPAQRADIFRLARLHRDGGYYVDADDRARRGFTAQLPPGATLVMHQEDLGSAGNNIIGAVPGHPVIGAALHGAVSAVLRGDRDIVWLSTGPGLLTRALAHWLASTPTDMASRLAATSVLTLSEMRAVAAMHCHAAYKTTPRAWLNSAFPVRKRA